VVKLGDCLKKLILRVTFLIFGLKLVWFFRCVVLSYPGSFFNVTAMFLLLKLRASNFCEDGAPSPKTSDYNFAYASDIAEDSGRDSGHIVELLY
jgi:hypothetical protein